MNREALDEFFAKADDVLADWAGSEDAMLVEDGEVVDYFGGFESAWDAMINRLVIPAGTFLGVDLAADTDAAGAVWCELHTGDPVPRVDLPVTLLHPAPVVAQPYAEGDLVTFHDPTTGPRQLRVHSVRPAGSNGYVMELEPT